MSGQKVAGIPTYHLEGYTEPVLLTARADSGTYHVPSIKHGSAYPVCKNHIFRSLSARSLENARRKHNVSICEQCDRETDGDGYPDSGPLGMGLKETHRHYSPKTTRTVVERVEEMAGEITGTEHGFHKSLCLLMAYFDWLSQDMECPGCGEHNVVVTDSWGLECPDCPYRDVPAGYLEIDDPSNSELAVSLGESE